MIINRACARVIATKENGQSTSTKRGVGQTIQSARVCHEAQCMFDVVADIVSATSDSRHDDNSAFLEVGWVRMCVLESLV